MEPKPKKQRTTATSTTTTKTTVDTTMTTTIFDIPDDCWKQILSFIDNINFAIHQNNRQSLSTTCKHLLSVTNRLPYSLPFSDHLLSHPDLLRRILRRFSSSLHSLDLTRFSDDGDAALSLLAASPSDLRFVRRVSLSSYPHVPIKGLRRLAEVCSGLRVLKIGNYSSLSDDHVIEICNLFCLIEEFDVGVGYKSRISDVGILYLSKKLQSLSKINVSGYLITDDSLVALSDRCLSLSDVNVRGCEFVTQDGVSYMLRHCSKLNRLVVGSGYSSALSGPGSCFRLQDSFGFSHNLSTLDLHDIDVDDSLLISIAKAKLPLRKFMISFCRKFAVKGLTAFLGAYPNLEHLELNSITWLTDEIVGGLVHCFERLTVISLDACALTEATFCLLVKCCPVLEKICMAHLRVGEFSDLLVQNNSIKCLFLTDAWLTDEGLQNIGLMCPNLVHLNVDACCTLTSKGIEGVLKSCCDIKNLSAFEFLGSKLFDMDLECSGFKIEQLNLTSSDINDDGLSGIAKACPNLMVLNVTDCRITETGVKEVVRSCTKLESISLGRDLREGQVCPVLNPDIVMWMVKAGPSLKKIVAGFDYSPTSSDQEVFFNHGCSVVYPRMNTHEEDTD